jgi:hypothetical protein
MVLRENSCLVIMFYVVTGKAILKARFQWLYKAQKSATSNSHPIFFLLTSYIFQAVS